MALLDMTRIGFTSAGQLVAQGKTVSTNIFQWIHSSVEENLQIKMLLNPFCKVISSKLNPSLFA